MIQIYQNTQFLNLADLIRILSILCEIPPSNHFRDCYKDFINGPYSKPDPGQ